MSNISSVVQAVSNKTEIVRGKRLFIAFPFIFFSIVGRGGSKVQLKTVVDRRPSQIFVRAKCGVFEIGRTTEKIRQ